MASGLAGIAISYDKMIGCVVIGGINVIAMIVQGILLTKVYRMMPNLAKSKNIDAKNESYSKSYKANVHIMDHMIRPLMTVCVRRDLKLILRHFKRSHSKTK